MRNNPQTRQRLRTAAVMAVYMALCALFFAVRYSESYASNRFVVALPTAFIAFATMTAVRRGGIAIPAALAVSAVGDLMGAMDLFFGQVGFFAVAHIFFAYDFSRRIRFSFGRVAVAAISALAVAAYLAFILRGIDRLAVSIAVASYAFIIYCMLLSAVMQSRSRGVWYTVAAVLFVISDGMIAYGIGGGRLPYATVWIMTTYYAAQGIFARLFLLRGTPED